MVKRNSSSKDPVRTPLAISALRGATCTELGVISGGSLILHFDVANSLRRPGTVRLHIESAWRIESNECFLIGAFDTFSFEESAAQLKQGMRKIREIVGLSVRRASVVHPIYDLRIEFDNKFVLRSFCHGAVGDSWELRQADGRRLGMASPGKTKSWCETPDAELKKAFPRFPRKAPSR